MSAFSETGLSINVHEPLLAGGRFLFALTEQISSEQHETRALGGYWSAEIAVSVLALDMDDWIENGLGRDIAICDEAAQPVWQGFVNKVTIRFGDLTLVRGPLLDIANKVRVVYSTVDTSTTPPTLGTRTSTTNAQDADSQTKYGVLERVLGAGGATATNADAIRDTYLAENKLPQTTQTLAIGDSGSVAITLSCLGYVHWLTAYIYTQTSGGTQNASEKVQAVLAADPNAIFSTDYNGLTANTLAVPKYENDDRPAWDIIKAVVATGDTAAARWIFGMYGGRRAKYAPAPTTIDYQYQLSQHMLVQEVGGYPIAPWSVLPGKWLFVSDMLTGRGTPSDLKNDPRALFVESVNFSAPYGLTINGGKVSTLSQKLARLGLSGIGT